MISAICWIPKGAASGVSFIAEQPTDEELDNVISSDNCSDDNNNMKCNDKSDMDIADGAQEEDALRQAMNVANALSSQPVAYMDGINAALRELNMESYDEENGATIFGAGSEELFYHTNEKDPYFTKKDDGMDDEEEAEEIEDMTVQSTDMLIVSLHSEDSYNYLKVVIVEELEDGYLNMYPCVELPLRQFPLSLAWSDCCLKDGQKGNFMAVGTMGPKIEIWDLDMVDSLEPHTVLGGKSKDKKCKGKKILRYKKGSHSDSILGLAWNMEYKNVLASASADKTVKIWDVNVSKCVSTLKHHDSKVQAVAWCQQSPGIILSGSFDKSVALNDVKNSALNCIKWSVEADVETVAWDPHNQHMFLVTLENGMVQAYDMRGASSSQHSSVALFTLHAHEKAVTTASFSAAPNVLATASIDKMVKLWDISNNQPSCVASLNPEVGPIFSVSFSKDSPFLLAVGGCNGDVTVWDTLAETSVVGRYGVRTDAPVANKKVYHCV